MARGWHYAKLSLSSALLLSFSGICILLLFLSFCRFCFVSLCFFVFFFVFALVGALQMFLSYFPVQQATYRIGNHVYYWVRLRPDRLM